MQSTVYMKEMCKVFYRDLIYVCFMLTVVKFFRDV